MCPVPVTEFRGMALNGLFWPDVLRPLDPVPFTEFTYKIPPCVWCTLMMMMMMMMMMMVMIMRNDDDCDEYDTRAALSY